MDTYPYATPRSSTGRWWAQYGRNWADAAHRAPDGKNHLEAIFDALRVDCRVTAVLEGIRLGEIDELQAYVDLEGRRRCEVGK